MDQNTIVHLEDAVTTDELRSNVDAFRAGWKLAPSLMRELGLLRTGRYWIHDPETGGFANAKFAGYRDMTPDKYLRARSGAFDGSSQFTGGVNTRIARRLGIAWRDDQRLAQLLLVFAASVDGVDAMTGVDPRKWRFIELPFREMRPSDDEKSALIGELSGDESKELAVLWGEEGGRRLVSHQRIERDSTLVQAIKKRWFEADRHLECVVCGFSFLRTYGELGAGFIEAHHQKSLSDREASGISSEDDFDRICSNCHSMLHRMADEMSVDRLREIVLALRGRG